MVTIPLMNRLRKESHRNIAMAQDLLAIEIYGHFPEAVIHGGTAIWRCYGGNRFSEDVDVYLPKKYKKSENIKAFVSGMKSKGFVAGKFREKENSIFSAFSYNGAVVRFEATFQDKKNSVIKPFEMLDGTFMNVRTLQPDGLILEKISAYENRRKIRDIYDVYFLLRLVEDVTKVKPSLGAFLQNFRSPADAAELKAIIIAGAVPAVEEMLMEIKRWAG